MFQCVRVPDERLGVITNATPGPSPSGMALLIRAAGGHPLEPVDTPALEGGVNPHTSAHCRDENPEGNCDNHP